MLSRSMFLLLLFGSSCILYHVSPPQARYVDLKQDEWKNREVYLSVDIKQVESPEFRKRRNEDMSRMARHYNYQVLSGLKLAIETRQGVIVDRSSPYKIILSSELPESTQNDIWVGCAGLLTLFVFPVWNSYEYPVSVIVMEHGREIKRTTYQYSTTQVVGWLVPFANLLVSPWKPNVYVTSESRDKDVGRLTTTFNRRVADDVFKDLFREPPPAPLPGTL